jgi:hypothetical protein
MKNLLFYLLVFAFSLLGASSARVRADLISNNSVANLSSQKQKPEVNDEDYGKSLQQKSSLDLAKRLKAWKVSQGSHSQLQKKQLWYHPPEASGKREQELEPETFTYDDISQSTLEILRQNAALIEKLKPETSTNGQISQNTQQLPKQNSVLEPQLKAETLTKSEVSQKTPQLPKKNVALVKELKPKTYVNTKVSQYNQQLPQQNDTLAQGGKPKVFRISQVPKNIQQPLKQDDTLNPEPKPETSTNTEISPKTQQPNTIAELEKATKGFTVFPVGLSLGKRVVNPSLLVRGEEDGTQAINLDNWLLPFDGVIAGLSLTVTSLPDGQLELRSPGVVTRIDPKKLRTDPELGLVFSIKDLDNLFGIKAKFDINDYAIQLDVPWLGKTLGSAGEAETPILLEGLPSFSPGNFGFGAIEQKFNASGSEGSSTSYRGDLLAVGSAFGGSWFVRADQPNFQDTSTWRIAESQFLRQTNQADFILGSQPTFWRSQGSNDYWGLTFIQRQGFVPPQQYNGGFVDPRLRLQASQIGRTITGSAQPGTLVRLVEAFGDRFIGEVLVDSSGIYRFENVKSDNQSFGGNYRLLLYPDGRLTAQPEIRDATYSIVPGQLPTGASALVVSSGLRRDFNNQSLLGNFSEFRGGVAQRWGLSEELTVGLGGVYDDSARGVAELFFRPSNLPLQVAVSALSGNKWDVNADVRYSPTPSISTGFTSDRFSNRFNMDWRLSSALGLFANTDSRDRSTAYGLQLNFSGKDAFTFARASLDNSNRLRWSLLQRLGALELNQRGNEIGTLSELTYNLSGNTNFLNLGNSLLLNYETRDQFRSDDLVTLGWQYRSKQQANDGSYLWEGQLGYGVGSQGSGPLVTLSTTALPGIMVRARYQGVSVTSDQSTFSIDLVSSLGLQRGVTPGDRHSDYLRTQGGLLIQPFYDDNNNGKQDGDEKIYTDNADSLITINNKAIKSLHPLIQGDRILVRLHPGAYRLDLDPAGFPENWQVAADAYKINVVAGSYTPVSLPLVRAYTVSGVIADAQGKPTNGARVEAISATSGKKRLFSVTNSAGVYYLERLQQDSYNVFINDQPVTGLKLKLDRFSVGLQEINIQQSENQEFQAINSSFNQSASSKSVKGNRE